MTQRIDWADAFIGKNIAIDHYSEGIPLTPEDYAAIDTYFSIRETEGPLRDLLRKAFLDASVRGRMRSSEEQYSISENTQPCGRIIGYSDERRVVTILENGLGIYEHPHPCTCEYCRTLGDDLPRKTPRNQGADSFIQKDF